MFLFKAKIKKPGSRGGKIVGYTKGGNPIYEKKGKKTSIKSSKPVEEIKHQGQKRFIYPEDRQGKKRILTDGIDNHINHFNSRISKADRLDKSEVGYVKKMGVSLHKYLMKNNINPANGAELNEALNKFLKSKKIDKDSLLKLAKKEKLSEKETNNVINNYNMYHQLALTAVREDLLHRKEPLDKTVIGATKSQKTIKREVGQPKQTNKDYPHYHPKAMPKDSKGNSYYTEHYVKEVAPSGFNKPSWTKAVNEYLDKNGSKGYNWDFKKLTDAYHKIEEQAGSKIPDYLKSKSKDMFTRTYIINNPPPFAQKSPDIWKRVVEKMLPKDKYGTRISSKEFKNKISGMTAYFHNAYRKYKVQKGTFFIEKILSKGA